MTLSVRKLTVCNFMFWSYCCLFSITIEENHTEAFLFEDVYMKNKAVFYQDKIIVPKHFDELPEQSIGMKSYHKKVDEQKGFMKHQDKLFRRALTKGLANDNFRKKFVEVIPILRVLSKPQRIAFVSLLNTQMTLKPGQNLLLKEVQTIFGHDNRKLILPLVFDIAYMIKNAAKSQIKLENTYETDESSFVGRRNYDISPREEVYFYHRKYEEEVMDAKTINEELFPVISKHSNNGTHFRLKRDTNGQFLGSLKFQPGSSNMGDYKKIEDENSYSNKSYLGFLGDKVDKNFEASIEIEILPIIGLNESDSRDNENNVNNGFNSEKLPQPEGLIASKRQTAWANKINQHHFMQPHIHKNIYEDCEKFTWIMCIRAKDYPMQQIMGSIHRLKHAISTLFADFKDITKDNQEHILIKNKRQDEPVATKGICSSVVRYARPQIARSATGDWKFIVNTRQHTQTLRLEKCSHAHERCSFLTDDYRSRCVQVYNYHRLLSWDKQRGLHVDIFKVPTCCSCHVESYRNLYPPLSSQFTIKIKDEEYDGKDTSYGATSVDDEYEREDDSGFKSIFVKQANYLKRTKLNNADLDEELFATTSINSEQRMDKTASHSSNLSVFLNPPRGNINSNFPRKSGSEISSSSVKFLSDVDFLSYRPISNEKLSIGDRLDEDRSRNDNSKYKVMSSNMAISNTLGPETKQFSSLLKAQQKMTYTDNGIFPSLRPSIVPYLNVEFETDVNKRINYNYHPIIDFFRDQSRYSLNSDRSKKIESEHTIKRIRTEPVLYSNRNPVILQ